ncbi:MAG: hypothetical protein K6G12_09110 [Lachnospiraceae bacterium]|nr:hypothetical protein [Lachnospiraceae bacterium]
MEESSATRKGQIKYYILLILVSIAVAAGIYFLYSVSVIRALETLVIVVLGQIIVIFTYESGIIYDTLLTGHIYPKGRFYIVYVILMAGSLVIAQMPVTAWPFVVVFVLLTILSNIPCGVVSGCMCLFVASSAMDVGVYPFIYVYMLSGIAAAVLVAYIDERFKIGLPLSIVVIILLTGLCITVITSAQVISIELFLYPAINIAITVILLIFILKAYSAKVIFKEKDEYIELNDPECMVLTELKNIAPDDYHKTVHVVYFCDRVSAALDMDAPKIKCAGLYHRVGMIGGAYNWENTRAVCEEQNLPEDVMTILREFEDPSVQIKQPETAVLYMCECVVSSIQYLFAKNKEVKLDYPSLIEAIFKQRIESGLFNDCDMSIRQFELMKKVFVGEKLYYDFLR